MRAWTRILVLGLVVLAASVSTAHARTLTVRPDGTGDVPTFQAGVDSLFQGALPLDSLLVMPGRYDESVRLNSPPPDLPYTGGGGNIICPGGPEQTSLRAFQFPTDHTYFSFYLGVEGLTVQSTVTLDGFLNTSVDWRRCVFEGGFFGMGNDWGGISHCEFRGRSTLRGYYSVDACRFVGGPIRFDPNGWSTTVTGCTFEGPADTAVIAPLSDAQLILRDCTFKRVGNAIVLDHGHDGSLYVRRCEFVDISGPAIGLIEHGAGDGNPGAVVVVDSSMFARCGSGLALQGPGIGVRALFMAADTLRDCRSGAIEAAIRSARLSDVLIEGVGGPGIVLNAWQHPNGFDSRLTRCVVGDARGDGIRIDGGTSTSYYQQADVESCTVTGAGGYGCVVVATGMRLSDNLIVGSGLAGARVELLPELCDCRGFEEAVLQRNTFAASHGAGCEFLCQPGTTDPRLSLGNNLSVANAGAGFDLRAEVSSVNRGNDAWANTGPAYAGFDPGDLNVTLDPQFCDPVRGDFHVAAGSPCAPSGPYGQIGALGVGCDVMRVSADARPSTEHDVVQPGSRGLLPVAILGSRYFDVSRVDSRSVRLAGAAPAERGHGDPRVRDRDVNGDDIDDRLLWFRGDELQLRREDDTAQLAGSTLDGIAFEAEVAVAMVHRGNGVASGRGGATPTSTGAEGVEQPVALGVLSVSMGARSVEVHLGLPNFEPARVEVFDVSGRRVAAEALQLGAGSHRVSLVVPRQLGHGIYWIKLQQGRAVATKRAVFAR